MKTKAELDAKLWELYNGGLMPVSLLMHYSTYLELAKDVEFFACMHYDIAGNEYESLAVSFDKTLWPGEIRIETRTRVHGE
jgi:hypothetical protein